MKFEKELSRIYKHRALVWLRIRQRCAFMTTEFGYYNADAYGCNEKKSYEIEVKVSWADFKNDFKKFKHQRYSRNSMFASNDRYIPTHFYYAVPKDIVDKCKKYLEERHNDYGLIDADSFIVVKRAKTLNPNPPCSKIKFQCALRMGSELLRFHEALL